jgi:diadenosine tetraphosphate (Ap4A) HIT family hydrolase
VSKLAVSTLYLDRNQTYRGHCQLIYDEAHVEGLEHLPSGEFARFAEDLHRAANAISRVCRPDRMNYASLGNVVPHVHWHLVPDTRPTHVGVRPSTRPIWRQWLSLDYQPSNTVVSFKTSICRCWRVPHNKSLQRSANHKVLGRGRMVSAPWRAPARPRADKSARGR